MKYEPENLLYEFAKTKTKISCAVTAKLISAFVFAICSAIHLLSKSKISHLSHRLWLYSPVSVGLVGNPNDRFSHVYILECFLGVCEECSTSSKSSSSRNFRFLFSLDDSLLLATSRGLVRCSVTVSYLFSLIILCFLSRREKWINVVL